MVNVGVEPEAAKTQGLSSSNEGGPGSDGTEIRSHAARVLLVDQGSRGRSSTSSEVVHPLESLGYRVQCVDSDSEALEALKRTPPDVLILTVSRERSGGSGRPGAELRAAAQNLGIPVLDMLDSGPDLSPASGPSPEADDWVDSRRQRGRTRGAGGAVAPWPQGHCGDGSSRLGSSG